MRDACHCVLRTSQPVREPSERLVRGEQFEMPFPLGAIPALCVMSRQRERCTARARMQQRAHGAGPKKRARARTHLVRHRLRHHQGEG